MYIFLCVHFRVQHFLRLKKSPRQREEPLVPHNDTIYQPLRSDRIWYKVNF